MRYALIKNGVVENVFVAKNYRDSQLVAIAHNGEAIDIDLYNVGIGYTYIDGAFYTPGGKLVVRQLTSDERIELLQKAFDDLLLGGV